MEVLTDTKAHPSVLVHLDTERPSSSRETNGRGGSVLAANDGMEPILWIRDRHTTHHSSTVAKGYGHELVEWFPARVVCPGRRVCIDEHSIDSIDSTRHGPSVDVPDQ